MSEKGFATPLILVVVALGVLVIGSVAYFQLKPQSTAQPKPTQITPSPTQGRSSAQKDDTADWRTYTNTKYKYQIKHPSDWELDSEADYFFISSNYNDILLTVRENIKDTSEAEKAVCGPPACGNVKFEDTRIGDLVFRTPESSALFLFKDTGDWVSYLLSDGTLYVFLMNTQNQEEDLKTFNRILSTFKFLD